ncbi:MAG TPA: phage major capsid protein, partial [Arenicellales bacterium]|nr:phage major capsid protein [Arenicellales bacterium]
MSESIQQKRERRNALAKETRALLDRVSGSDWNEEHQAKYDENVSQIERIDGEIDRYQKMLDLQAEREFSEMGVSERDAIEANPGRSLFNKWMRGGDNALNAEEWQAVRNTMSTTTDSEGGYTVPEEVVSSVLEAMAAYGGMRQVANVIQTADGQKFNYPTSDGTSEEGELVAENTAATDSDPTFGTKSLDVY